ncbi:MAG: type II 3-dehydroquinate dehydratase [Bacteroidales bacterium]|nr:type II 3-dehydroquinate dehydratase [Bacteroidales bacterium]
MKISIINGPNLNLLGKREPSIYGNTTFEFFLQQLKARYNKIEIDYFQSNVEGEIINKLHEVGFSYHGIILNAGGYSHTSVSIADAVRAVSTPVIEIHLSNIYSREEYRRYSLVAPHAQGVILGFGLDSYRLAIESFMT